MQNKPQLIFIIAIISLLFSNCYSFRGTSIPQDISTFYVENFTIESYDAPANLPIEMSEKLRNKIRSESRLKYTDTDPDIEFKGRISGYRVTPVAPQNNQLPSANRLEITVSINYIDNKNNKNNWNNNFTFFKDFDNTTNVLDIRESLSNEIFDQIAEDIFNRAFSNW